MLNAPIWLQGAFIIMKEKNMEENNNQNMNSVTSPSLKKKSRSKLWFWIFGIILVIALGYIGYDKHSEWRDDQDEEIYQNGTFQGYNQAIMEVVSRVNTCEQVPMTYVNNAGKNQTINIFKVECIQPQTQL